MTTLCDNHSFGILARNEHGDYLVIDHVDPVGVAPAAGHLDGLTYEQAARRAITHDLGLTVREVAPVLNEWRPDSCYRDPGTKGTGHYWQLLWADVDGPLALTPGPDCRARWVSGGELDDLARTTIAYAKGLMTPGEFAAAPGLSPVWVALLDDAHVITVALEDRAAVEALVLDPAAPSTDCSSPSAADWQARIGRICRMNVTVTAVLAWPTGGGYDVHALLPEGATRQPIARHADSLAFDTTVHEGGCWSIEVAPGIGPEWAVLHVAAVDQDQTALPVDRLVWSADDIVERAERREAVRQELIDVRAELARVDSKAGLLLAFALGGLTAAGALLTAGPELPWWAQGCAITAVGVLAAAAVFLLLAVRPKLRGGVGFMAHTDLTTDGSNARAVLDAVALEHKAREVRHLSRLALDKFRAVQRAVDLTVIALVGLLIALIGA